MLVTLEPLFIHYSTPLMKYPHIRTKIILGLKVRQRLITECDRFRDYKVPQSRIVNCDRVWITKGDKKF